MIREALLTPNPSSRPQLRIRRVDCIVLHWVENPGSTAEANRRYFESLKDDSRKASAHYIIDSREIVRCIPETEVAYHAGPGGAWQYTPWALQRWGGEHANWYCLGIEHCHPDVSGRFERIVLQRSHLLAAGLCLTYGLDPTEAIVLHNTITGKDCPRWMVAHPEELVRYRDAVAEILEAGV
jgi:N-acetylmuramoyl-L-alanine amidase